MYISQSLNLSSVSCTKEKSTLNRIIFQLYCEQLKRYRFEDFLELQNRLKRRYSLFPFSIPPTTEIVLSTVSAVDARCLLSTRQIHSPLECITDLFQIQTGKLLNVFNSFYDPFICCICHSSE